MCLKHSALQCFCGANCIFLQLMNKRALLLILLLFEALSLKAETASQTGDRIPTVKSSLSCRRFTTSDGLSQMQTETIWQDEKGYIYIGTLSGFVRYDGRRMQPFLGGRQENIVLFRSCGRKVLALGFVRQWNVKGSNLEQSQIDPSGQRLLNNFNSPANPSNYVLLEDRKEENRILCKLGEKGMETVLESLVLDEMTPDRKLCIDSSGIYIPTPNGLYVYADGNISKLTRKTDIFSLIRSSGNLYALAADGIYVVCKDSLSLLLEYKFESPDYGLSVQKDNQGRLYIADSHTIWRFDKKSGKTLDQLGSGFNLIKGLFVDKWNRLWAATYQGAYCFFHCNFTNHRLTDRNDIARAIAIRDGKPTFGTLNGKVIEDQTIVSNQEEQSYEPGAAVFDDKTYLAASTDVACIQGGVLNWLSLPNGRYSFVSRYGKKLIIGARNCIMAYNPEDSSIDTLTTEILRPWCAADDGQGRLWVSGNPGLFCITGVETGKIAVDKIASTPATPVITAMASDGKGSVCYALGDTLFVLRDGQINVMEETLPALKGHEIRSIHISPRGYLAVAAIDGLLVARISNGFRAEDIHWFNSENGFTSIEPLRGPMAEEENGTVWLAGVEDMISFNPEALLSDNQQSTIVEAPLKWWQRWWLWLSVAALLSLAVWRISAGFEKRRSLRKIELLKREKLQKELQLRAVRLKAIPHFHSNVISGIEYFVMNKASDEASYYLKLYSDFTNQTLSDIDRSSRTIAEEVGYVSKYLELEKLRYGEKLNYEIKTDSSVNQNIMLPNMLLHTYCQNAVKHGIASKSGKGNIEVSICGQRRDGADGVLVCVSDDGIGRKEAARIGGYSTGQGLKILQQQIELCNRANNHKIVQEIEDLTDGLGKPAGTCFRAWIPIDYQY